MTAETTASPDPIEPPFKPYRCQALLVAHGEPGVDRLTDVIVLERPAPDPGVSAVHVVRCLVRGEREPRPIAVCRLTEPNKGDPR